MARVGHDVFGDVRALLSHEPCVHAFTAVCAMWPEGDVPEEIVEYVRGVTRHWPLEVPLGVPQRWAERVERGAPCSGIAMCTSLHIRAQERGSHRLRKWMEYSALTHLRELAITGEHWRLTVPARLLCAEKFARVESLTLTNCAFKLDMSELVETPLMRGLKRLEFSGGYMRRADVSALVGAPVLAQLSHLTLRGCILGDDAGAAMAQSWALSQLEHLDLGGNRGPFSELFAVLPKTLRTLSLESCRPSEPDLHALANALSLSGLHHLSLKSCSMSHEAAQALATSPCLHHLKSLDLSHSFLPEVVVRTLVESVLMHGVERLNVSRCYMRSSALAALSEGMYIQHITHLDVSLNPIGDEGAEALATSPRLERLRSLDVQGCELSVLGVRALTQADFFAQLESLHIQDNLDEAQSYYELWKTPYMQGSDEFRVCADELHTDALSEILDEPALDGVKHVIVSQGANDHRFLPLLCSSARFCALESISISRMVLTESDCVALAAWPRLAGVTSLQLWLTGLLQMRHLEALLDSTFLRHLEVFEFASPRLDSSQLVNALLCWEGHTSLRVLRLGPCRLDVHDLERLIRALCVANLRELVCDVDGPDREHAQEFASVHGVRLMYHEQRHAEEVSDVTRTG
jgi:hypothetical protein